MVSNKKNHTVVSRIKKVAYLLYTFGFLHFPLPSFYLDAKTFKNLSHFFLNHGMNLCPSMTNFLTYRLNCNYYCQYYHCLHICRRICIYECMYVCMHSCVSTYTVIVGSEKCKTLTSPIYY